MDKVVAVHVLVLMSTLVALDRLGFVTFQHGDMMSRGKKMSLAFKLMFILMNYIDRLGEFTWPRGGKSTKKFYLGMGAIT